jgi:hypothetical protein
MAIIFCRVCLAKAFGGSCYKLIFHPSDFDIAEERCLEHNSFLVAIASLEENQLPGVESDVLDWYFSQL